MNACHASNPNIEAANTPAIPVLMSDSVVPSAQSSSANPAPPINTANLVPTAAAMIPHATTSNVFVV